MSERGVIGDRHRIHTTESAAIATPLFLTEGMAKSIGHSNMKKAREPDSQALQE
jgi:hypothetical protein